ncbi:MAG: hypothetical protein FJ179_05715 [Gammaproteobacteria bacterium]|nr:hypothetical protein [Gammaproteobacteria bacterium]
MSTDQRFKDQAFIVIRGIGPSRLRVFLVLGLVVLVLLGWGLFQLGRSGIGIGVTNPLSSMAALRRAISERDVTIVDLRRQVAELDTLKVAQDRERQELAQSIGELQAEVARQRQQLEFYKGIVATAEAPANIAIRTLRIDDSRAGSRPLLRLSLVQPGNPQNVVSGTVTVTLEGARAARYPLFETAYSFRYFENVERELVVPSGVTPERLTVEIRPADRAMRPVVQSVFWPP